MNSMRTPYCVESINGDIFVELRVKRYTHKNEIREDTENEKNKNKSKKITGL